MSRVNHGALRDPHKGLLLDCYLYRGVDANGKTIQPDWSEAARYRSDHTAYKLAFARWKSLWPSSTQIISVERRVQGRLAIGLGAETVLENSVRLHHTYGTPLIPGSSVRGALRAQVKDIGERDFLFGPETAGTAGFVRCQDAWWIPAEGKSGLDIDVATVHHQDYYGGVGAPTDFDDPNPVHFLTISGKFLFVIETPNEAWKPWLEKLLKMTLSHYGLGAKRSAGYGRFTV